MGSQRFRYFATMPTAPVCTGPEMHPSSGLANEQSLLIYSMPMKQRGLSERVGALSPCARPPLHVHAYTPDTVCDADYLASALSGVLHCERRRVCVSLGHAPTVSSGHRTRTDEHARTHTHTRARAHTSPNNSTHKAKRRALEEGFRHALSASRFLSQCQPHPLSLVHNRASLSMQLPTQSSVIASTISHR